MNMNASLEPNKIKGKDKTTLSDEAERFDEDDMTSVVSDDAEWTPGKNVKVKEVKTKKGNDNNGDLFSILPDRNKDDADVSSMYDIDDDDEDEDFLGAGIENLSNIDETSEEEAARIKAEEEAKKKAEEEAKKEKYQYQGWKSEFYGKINENDTISCELIVCLLYTSPSPRDRG